VKFTLEAEDSPFKEMKSIGSGSVGVLTLAVVLSLLNYAVGNNATLPLTALQEDNWHVGYTNMHLHRHHYHPMPLHSAVDDAVSLLAPKQNGRKGRSHINDNALNYRYQAEADREHREREVLKEERGMIQYAESLVVHNEKMRRKTFSHIAGVTFGALENARNATLSGIITSCAELIAQSFADGSFRSRSFHAMLFLRDTPGHFHPLTSLLRLFRCHSCSTRFERLERRTQR
jgi:hypothetical protein